MLHRNAGRIEHEVADPGLRQEPMQPEPVMAGLIATPHTRRRAELLGRPPAEPFDQRQQFGVISPCDPMAGNPVPIRAVQRHQPALLTQFDCNENCATMAGGGRVCGRCLHLTLRWFECGNPNLPERPRSPPHGIYKWWNWHDQYSAEAAPDRRWGETVDSARRGEA